MKTLLAISILLLAGCADDTTKMFNGQEIASPLTEEQALEAATLVTRVLRMDGHESLLVPRVDGRSNSMGQAISDTAVCVLMDDFDGTQPGDVVVYWRYATETSLSADGRPVVSPAGKAYVIHQVVSRDTTSLRSRGLNNSRFDKATIFRDTYVGTVVAQVYYRPDPSL